MFGTNSFKTLMAAGALALMASGASAAPVEFMSCVGTDPAYNISGKVSSAYDCTISKDDDQDFLNTDPITVNKAPGFFGEMDWTFLAKDESSTAQGASGAWNFSAAIAALSLPAVGERIDKLMLIFKSGNDTTLVGYLVSATSGTWASPFTDPPFDLGSSSSPKNVSHISAYYTTAAVPLPAAGFLLIGALGGLAALRRRRRAA